MSLWNTITGWFGATAAATCTTKATTVEEAMPPATATSGDTLAEMLIGVGVEEGYVRNRVVPAHNKWYDGVNTKEAIKNSLLGFMATHRGICRNIALKVKEL